MKESYQKFEQPTPKQSFAEGQGQPNDHCASNSNCPVHKMNDHLTKDEENGNNSEASEESTDVTIGATYNE
jgi:hypothetical protein